MTITPPLDLVQGYKAFIAYAPINYSDKFDGFIVGVFAVTEFLSKAISVETSDNFAVYLSYEGKQFFQNATANVKLDKRWEAEQLIQINDKVWTLRLVPTQHFVTERLSNFPNLILMAGLLISALLSITVRYIILAKLKSNYLVNSNKLNDAILSNAAYLIIATDLNGKVILFNEAAEENLGYMAKDLIGVRTPALWHDPEEVALRALQLSNELNRDIEPGFEVFTMIPDAAGDEAGQWTFIRKDGTRFAVSLTVSVLKDGSGNTTGYLEIAEDISERVRQQKALEASEKTFRSAMEYASIGMALVSLEGRFLLVNQSLCNIVGYTNQELISLDFQTITHPDDLDADIENVEKMIQGSIQTYQMEKRYLHKDGRTVWINLNVSMARNDDDTPKHFIAQIQDITARKEIDRIKSEFISVVSHELRTPLTSIRGSLGLIEGTMAKELPEKALSLIKIAHKNSERLILLINDILDLDKIAAGKMRFDMKICRVTDLVQAGVESNKSYADKFKVSLCSDPISDELTIKADAGRWQQVFSNLVSNAIKFSPEGEAVQIQVIRIDGKVRICVRDEGAGIPEEFRSRIFTKFSQADSTNARNKGGTGLGLSISKEIVNQMGGDVGFESTIGEGSVFWFEFPLEERVFLEAVIVSEVQEQSDLPTILHVEDDEDFGKVIAAALQDKANVRTVNNLAAAREKLKQGQYSLIIVDIALPDGSGLSFIDDMRAQKIQTPIVILSVDEAPAKIRKKVAACLVKSRISEAKIIETILSCMNKTKKD